MKALLEISAHNQYNFNLLPETTITKEEALIKYKEAYDYIAGKACVLGIVPDLDNYEFQQYIKGYTNFY